VFVRVCFNYFPANKCTATVLKIISLFIAVIFVTALRVVGLEKIKLLID